MKNGRCRRMHTSRRGHAHWLPRAGQTSVQWRILYDSSSCWCWPAVKVPVPVLLYDRTFSPTIRVINHKPSWCRLRCMEFKFELQFQHLPIPLTDLCTPPADQNVRSNRNLWTKTVRTTQSNRNYHKIILKFTTALSSTKSIRVHGTSVVACVQQI